MEGVERFWPGTRLSCTYLTAWNGVLLVCCRRAASCRAAQASPHRFDSPSHQPPPEPTTRLQYAAPDTPPHTIQLITHKQTPPTHS